MDRRAQLAKRGIRLVKIDDDADAMDEEDGRPRKSMRFSTETKPAAAASSAPST